MKLDVESLAHTKWECKYHIVFAPKYRRQIIYGKIKDNIGKMLRKLCEYKGVEIHEAEACKDHIMQHDYLIHSYADEFRFANQVYVSHDITDELCEEINSFTGERAYILVQCGAEYTVYIKKIVDQIEYSTLSVDSNILTCFDVYPNDALLVVDYTRPKLSSD